MRSLAAALVVPLVALTAPAAASAAAPGPTCQGRPATVVGKPGGLVRGTDGRDVVVTAGARRVSTGDGADLVCVTGRNPRGTVSVSVGAGADTVDARRSRSRVSASLGTGVDRFTGSAHSDRVDLDKGPRELVRTGAGNDVVFVRATAIDPLPRLTITLGAGDDTVDATSGILGTLHGGTGSDRLRLSSARGVERLSIDNDRGIGSLDDQQLRWDGLERFGLPWAHRVDLVGGRGAEEVNVGGAAQLHSRLGGGADILGLDDVPEPDSVFDVDLGGGHDRLGLSPGLEASRVDLPGQTWTVTDRVWNGRRYVPGTPYDLGFAGVEDVGARGIDDLSVIGDAEDNHLRVRYGCVVSYDGGGGDDRMTQENLTGCRGRIVVADGGPGDDVLVGGTGDDTLVGGPGRDRADGGRGRDTCEAETRVACEV